MEIKVYDNVLKANDRLAENNRRVFAERGITAINFIASPGSGKTTLLEVTVPRFRDRTGLSIGVIEGDVATTRDAERISRLEVPVVQINTRGGCHLDAGQIGSVLSDIGNPDLLFIENVGNLVCPAAYDLGEAHTVAMVSVAEGDDKILKYPAAFRRSSVVLLNKIDLLPLLNYNMDQVRQDLAQVAPGTEILEMSCTAGTGLDAWIEWLVRAQEGS